MIRGSNRKAISAYYVYTYPELPTSPRLARDAMTTAFDLLQQLRLNWIQNVREVWHHDTPGIVIGDSLLEQFFQTITDGLLTNQWTTVEAFVDLLYAERSQVSQAQSDFETYAYDSYVGLIHTLHGALLTASSAVHDPAETMKLIKATEPIMFHMIEYAAYREAHIQHDLAAKEQQAAKQAMEMLNDSRSRFIGMATQNLRTPLTLIEGYLSMIKERSLDDAELLAWLNGIAGGSEKMRTAIDELIDVAMVDNQMLSLHYSQAKVGEILESVKKRLKPEVKSRSLTLKIHRCDEYGQNIFIDHERIEQAIGYVVENAIRVSPKGAVIILRGRGLYGFLELTIEDGGPGIALQDQTAIFEPFNTMEISAPDHPRNMHQYIGLHLAKGILESHGGAIWVSSSGYDERNLPGSTFHIMIPLREEPPDDLTARLLGVREVK